MGSSSCVVKGPPARWAVRRTVPGAGVEVYVARLDERFLGHAWFERRDAGSRPPSRFSCEGPRPSRGRVVGPRRGGARTSVAVIHRAAWLDRRVARGAGFGWWGAARAPAPGSWMAGIPIIVRLCAPCVPPPCCMAGAGAGGASAGGAARSHRGCAAGAACTELGGPEVRQRGTAGSGPRGNRHGGNHGRHPDHGSLQIVAPG